MKSRTIRTTKSHRILRVSQLTSPAKKETVQPMNANSPRSHSELVRACAQLWGRIQHREPASPSWNAHVRFDLLEQSSRTLWTSYDLFPTEPNHGIVAQLGRYFKKRGFPHRTVRGIIDVRRGRKLPHCTVWRKSSAPLPAAFTTERDWRWRYHLELLQTATVSDVKTYVAGFDLVSESLRRDILADDPDTDASDAVCRLKRRVNARS